MDCRLFFFFFELISASNPIAVDKYIQSWPENLGTRNPIKAWYAGSDCFLLIDEIPDVMNVSRGRVQRECWWSACASQSATARALAQGKPCAGRVLGSVLVCPCKTEGALHLAELDQLSILATGSHHVFQKPFALFSRFVFWLPLAFPFQSSVWLHLLCWAAQVTWLLCYLLLFPSLYLLQISWLLSSKPVTKILNGTGPRFDTWWTSVQ